VTSLCQFFQPLPVDPFESKGLKPGNHISGSKVKTSAFKLIRLVHTRTRSPYCLSFFCGEKVLANKVRYVIELSEKMSLRHGYFSS
jgi:hypothetical protein